MKKILVFLVWVCFVESLSAQTNRLIGRWTGIIDNSNITIVFSSGGRGIWKATRVYNPPMGDCKCNVETSSPITWRVLSSTSIRIVFGEDSGGSYSYLNQSECSKNERMNAPAYEGMKNAMLRDYTGKSISDSLLIEDADTVWIGGIEFTKEK